MISDAELATLVRQKESDRLERKADLTTADRIRDAICAFANDLPDHRAPGVVVVGQQDDGSCAGLRVDDTLLKRLSEFRSDGQLTPFPQMSVRSLMVDECEVAVMVVEPSTNPPVRRNGRVKVRIGPTTRDASLEEERRLTERRIWGTLPFDAQPVQGATEADLDRVRFLEEYLPRAISPEALAENHRPFQEQLATLRLARPDGTPTPTGLLNVGRTPQEWLPGAYVQFIRFAGATDTDPIIDQKQISGTLGDQARQLDELIRLHNANALTVDATDQGRHLVHGTYPEAAARQVCRNAIMHRTYEGSHAPVRFAWYTDRIEVLSPGGPYGQVTLETFGTPGVTDYRNPTIAESMRSQGLVERFGVGLQIVRRTMEENGNPAPQFKPTPAYVLVVLPRAG